MIATTAALALALVPGLVQAAAQYGLVKEYSGSSFFDDWTFYGNFDNLTNGDAIFVTESVASSSQLAFVNGAGNAIIKVDNTTTVPFNDKRNTVRISTNDSYSVGSVWVADMLHVPYGCSVWPAWWSQAPAWPSGGEIDTFEGVNLVTRNQMALHTNPGCTVANAVQTSTIVNSTDCSFQANDNQGCVVTDPDTASYGEAFASAGGGVFVTEFAESGINIWFFTRSKVPSSLTGSSVSSIDTSTLGTPTANYPSASCSSSEFFSAQHLIFDITLCGDFAGNNATFAQTCSGTCYNDYVIGPPGGYDNAYFEVQNVRVFGNSSTVVSGSGDSSSVSAPVTARGVASALVAGLLAAAAWFLV